MIPDERFHSEMQQLCVNNESDPVESPNTQMDFIIESAPIRKLTASCYCWRSCHVLKC